VSKVNIAGSGMGGSGVGTLLAKAGFDVDLFENLYCCCADTGTRHIGGELAAESALRLFEKLKEKNNRSD